MKNNKLNIVTIIVTYNRKDLLKECLEAILTQTRKVDQIVLIDNNSTDGTYEFLKENKILTKKNLYYKKTNKNIGGSGGFYTGMKEAQKFNPDWLWVMDDDVIPEPTALENLLRSINIIKDNISYLASCVYGTNNEFMNVPNINMEKSISGYPDWYKYLKNGIVKIKEATFVSLLINNKAVKTIGLPMKNYFIWGDDTEYTLRLTRNYGNAYFIGNSMVIHKRKISKVLSITEETDLNRINFYYYMIRNNLLNQKEYYGIKKCLKNFIFRQLQSIKLLFNLKCKYRFKKFIIIHKALLAFTFGNYDKKAFKNRYDINYEQ